MSNNYVFLGSYCFYIATCVIIQRLHRYAVNYKSVEIHVTERMLQTRGTQEIVRVMQYTITQKMANNRRSDLYVFFTMIPRSTNFCVFVRYEAHIHKLA